MPRSPSAGIKPPRLTLPAHPNDVELVDKYLRTWVETGVMTGGFIHDFDVYAADPADLTQQFEPVLASNGERVWYFYTPLRHKSLRDNRKARTVDTDAGCWHSEGKSKPVHVYHHPDVWQLIGYRKSFSFIKKDTGAKVRTGWLMVELRLVEGGRLVDGGAGQKPKADAKVEDALGNRVLCRVYRSPRNPEPSGSGAAAAAAAAAAALPGHKAEAEAEDDESSDATLDYDYGVGNDDDDNGGGDDDDSDDTWLTLACGPRGKPDNVKSGEATVASPSRHDKGNDEISAASGRKEKAKADEVPIETSAGAPSRKRKALDEETSGAAGALKKRADSSSAPATPVSTTEMQCPQCGTHVHLVVAVKKTESISETENAKNDTAPGASDAPQRGETRGPSQKKTVRFLEFM